MGKKSKSSAAPTPLWKVIENDFQSEGKLEKDDDIFGAVSEEDFNKNIFGSIIRNSDGLEKALDQLLKLKEYLNLRSERLSEVFNSKLRDYFETVRVTLPTPFDETKWADLETLDTEDLNKKQVHFNGISTTILSLVSNISNFLKSLEIVVKHIDIFPSELDSYGNPPINCRKIWNPLVWLRMQLESKIKESSPGVTLDKLATSLNHAPKEGHLENMLITSFFLENTADKLDYSNSDNREEFMKNLQSKFGSLKVDQLTMVLPDILVAHSEDLVERLMQISRTTSL